MQQLTVRFLDNEVIEGSADDVSLDSPDFRLVAMSDTGNNSGALVPLPAVKKISLGAGPADKHAAEADKMVAVRFQDGEVLRGYLNGSLTHHRYGLSMTIYSQDKRTMDTVAIPYTSLKAVFYLKSWDARPHGFWNTDSAPLMQLLGDIREITKLYKSGSIDRDEFLARRRALLDRF